MLWYYSTTSFFFANTYLLTRILCLSLKIHYISPRAPGCILIDLIGQVVAVQTWFPNSYKYMENRKLFVSYNCIIKRSFIHNTLSCWRKPKPARFRFIRKNKNNPISYQQKVEVSQIICANFPLVHSCYSASMYLIL